MHTVQGWPLGSGAFVLLWLVSLLHLACWAESTCNAAQLNICACLRA